MDMYVGAVSNQKATCNSAKLIWMLKANIRALRPLHATVMDRHETNFKVKVKMPRDSFIKMIKNASCKPTENTF